MSYPIRSRFLVAVTLYVILPLAVNAFNIPDDQPYIYDYYDNGVTAEEYVAEYKGTPYRSHLLSASSDCIMQAEDFDNGGNNISWSFRNKGSNAYRKDIDEVRINGGGSGYVIGNVSAGDWLCYTFEVADAGEYELRICMSSDNVKNLFFEIDGKAAGKIISTPGLGWDNYTTVVNTGIMLTEGKHVLRWVPSNSMNMDYYVWHRTGEYVDTGDYGHQDLSYPREWTYVSNPMFTELTSPMFGVGFTSPLYTADPSAHVWNIDGKEVLYLYASHDMSPAQGCDHMDRYHIFSTEDMINWTDHGEVMNAATSNRYTGTVNNYGEEYMWAPDCNYNPSDGLYYFIYPHRIRMNGEPVWQHFLATSENPAGPWKCIGYIDGIPSTIDPCLFVDDDGQAYVFTSGQGGCWMTKLKRDNWLEMEGESVMLLGPDGNVASGFPSFHEGPWMFKKDGRYYLVYADGYTTVNRMQYSVADNIAGPYTPKGVFMNPMGCNTTHGSVVEFKGKWYTFYHTADFSGHGALRSVCYDEQTFDDEGNLNLLRNFGEPYGGTVRTFNGTESLTISAVEYNDGKGGNAYYKRDMSVPSRSADGVELDNFEFLRFTLKVARSGRYAMTLRAANLMADSKVAVAYDGTYKTAENGRELPDKNRVGSKQELYMFPLTLEAGEHYIELRVTRGAMKFYDFTLSTGAAYIPGTIEAEDLEADDYRYQDRGAWERNSKGYRDDVEVAIDSHSDGWHIGSTSSGDYYKYNFIAKESGVYTITTRLSDDPKASSRMRMYIDDEEIDDWSFSGKNDWNTYFDHDVKEVAISEGAHVLKFEVVRGPMNIDRFTFTRTGELSGIGETLYQNASSDCVSVYSIDGRLIKHNIDSRTALDGLDRGIYIVGGRKVAK